MSREENELRVTDRRRVYLDDEGTERVNTETEQPNLKPCYVEELEARTKAAEKQVQEVQSRFDQLRQQLQRETDETRQRLNRSADERAAGEKAKFIASLLPAHGQPEPAHCALPEMHLAKRFSKAFEVSRRPSKLR